ncbi:predicted protein [Streptomyces viridosporus ATCC 14672]|uniref:Predicted protein n=1 Tax=Streptomyces viridosporus (strain ATCC 14672 / DSM 40746 / JCM 4963 / KCTC 9882 / NRRL B-12104 / FH 1290) TaxID=566461 RepID=D5ZVM7_STRV1|nr:predicted protein [Streptomyces viridosporus ATCC 14672]
MSLRRHAVRSATPVAALRRSPPVAEPEDEQVVEHEPHHDPLLSGGAHARPHRFHAPADPLPRLP